MVPGRVAYMLSTKILSMFVKRGSIDDSLVSLVELIRFFHGENVRITDAEVDDVDVAGYGRMLHEFDSGVDRNESSMVSSGVGSCDMG